MVVGKAGRVMIFVRWHYRDGVYVRSHYRRHWRTPADGQIGLLLGLSWSETGGAP